jgi:hypothetical protein
MLILGHKNIQVYFCDSRYRMFHVKHSQGFQAKRQSCIFIWKPQGVGHEVSQHFVSKYKELNWILRLSPTAPLRITVTFEKAIPSRNKSGRTM